MQSRSTTAVRRSRGWVPNQHGAWAILISPLLVGAISAGFSWALIPLAALWILGYFAFFALTLWLKSQRMRDRKPALTYIAAAAIAGLVTLLLRPDLIAWTPLFVLPLGVGLWAAAARRERHLLVGIATVAGSSLMALVAHDAGGGSAWRTAGLLALMQFLYFTGTIFYVKSAIRERNNRNFWFASIAAHGVAAVVAGAINIWIGLVFALLTVRAAVVPRLHPTPKAMGIGEFASVLAVAISSLLLI